MWTLEFVPNAPSVLISRNIPENDFSGAIRAREDI